MSMQPPDDLLESTPLRGGGKHSLGDLLRMYEGSYCRLLRLAPDLDSFDGTSVSRVAGALDLYLTILERAPYTTSILLTYRFPSGDGVQSPPVAEPNARLCVYHDARLVELVSHCRRRRARGVRPWRSGCTPELHARWEMNRFLEKWLSFCTHQGHLLLRCTATAAPPPPLEHTLDRYPSDSF